MTDTASRTLFYGGVANYIAITEARMYHAIVKRIALQNFLRVNQKVYAPILKGCSPDIHQRFGGHHALGGERRDRVFGGTEIRECLKRCTPGVEYGGCPPA
jgi:hypothetical protein